MLFAVTEPQPVVMKTMRKDPLDLIQIIMKQNFKAASRATVSNPNQRPAAQKWVQEEEVLRAKTTDSFVLPRLHNEGDLCVNKLENQTSS